MFRHALSSALRHLARNRWYSMVSIGGLAVGLCAGTLVALVLRNQYSYDHFVPGHDRIFVVLTSFAPPGLAKGYSTLSLMQAVPRLRERLPEAEVVTAILEEGVRMTYGDRSSRELVYWAGPELLDLLPPRILAGDARSALASPDGVLVSRRVARRLFGRDAPVGAAVSVDGHPMTIRAVFEDPPVNRTHQVREIILSNVASFSQTYERARNAGSVPGGFNVTPGFTYVKLKAGADPANAARVLPEITKQNVGVPSFVDLDLVPIDRLNSHEGLHPGFHARMLLLGILGLAVLSVACVNFVNVQTARSVRRAREVAIRKLAGARRSMLVAQFLGESLLYAAFAGLLAVALSEWLLPHVNAFLDTGAALDFRDEPWLFAMLAGTTLLIGAMAGAYPAFVVSAWQPASALRGTSGTAPVGVRMRGALVALQFALLIGLAICAGVVYRQRAFALSEGLRVDGDQVLLLYDRQRRSALEDGIGQLPGVRSVTRASSTFLGKNGFGPLKALSMGVVRLKSGEAITVTLNVVDFRVFDFFGVKPLAGRLPRLGEPAPDDARQVVLNETAMRKFGLGPPERAAGQVVPLGTPRNPAKPGASTSSDVVAVVPDFSLSSVDEVIPPTAYYQNPPQLDLILIRLTGRAIPETLAAIDALWKRTEPVDPPFRFFLDDHMQRQYVGVLRQSQAFGLCALIAIALSCLGLFALTAATAERRTREIGVRKALGARTSAIVRLLLWQFTRPVLWGALLAWPVAAWTMHRWLQGFAYRIDLPLWLFPLAAAAALGIAVLTVAAHTIAVARTPPVTALRYE